MPGRRLGVGDKTGVGRRVGVGVAGNQSIVGDGVIVGRGEGLATSTVGVGTAVIGAHPASNSPTTNRATVLTLRWRCSSINQADKLIAFRTD